MKKNKPILLLLVSFCVYLLTISFIGTLVSPPLVYADGDTFPPPPDSTNNGKSSDSTYSSNDYTQDEDLNLIELLIKLSITKI